MELNGSLFFGLRNPMVHEEITADRKDFCYKRSCQGMNSQALLAFTVWEKGFFPSIPQ